MAEADKDVIWENSNCMPGTYVDRVVTSPYYRDFYLQSHSGLKGTARPTHYFLLADGGIEYCKTISQLCKLTHLLCYTYCRATGGISYAAPTYYADRLCDRSRLYLTRSWGVDQDALQAQLETDKADHLTARQTARDGKYRQGQPFDESVHPPKDKEELDHEKDDDASIAAFDRAQVLQSAMDEWYEYKATQTGNPWHGELKNIMFWM
jgi:eukaryotic translation initiation factor 2C